MASKYKKFVQVEDPSRLSFRCIFCWQMWSPNIQPGGRLPRNAYICPNGCAKDYDEAYKKWEKILRVRNPVTGRWEPVKETVTTDR